MRNGGDDSERFTAGPSIEASDDDRSELSEPPATVDRVDRARSVEAGPVSRGPKSRAKRTSTKPERKTLVSARPASEMPVKLAGTKPEPKAEPVVAQASPPKKANKQDKRGNRDNRKSRSAGPRSKRAPRSQAQPPVSRKDAAPETSRAPISFDPRTRLVDHPDQMRAIHAVRASVPPSARKEREDEISIPPSGDLDEHDERFFAEGEILSRPPEALHAGRVFGGRGSTEDLEARVPAVVIPPERRRKLTNYVKIAMGFSAVLCLAAVVRVGLSHVGHPMTEGSAAAAQVVTVAPPRVEPVAAPAVVPPPTAAVVPAPAEVAPAVAEEPGPPAKSAKEEKEDARKALEHAKLKDAVEAGERSVALDPTDAEAWLILGSAHQELGHGKSARDAFVQCTKEAKTGPVGECRLMLR